MPSPLAGPRRFNWMRGIVFLAVSPLIAVGLLLLGLGSVALLIVERLVGRPHWRIRPVAPVIAERPAV